MERIEVEHRMHLAFSLLSLGLWTISWLAIVIYSRLYPWRCTECDFRQQLTEAEATT